MGTYEAILADLNNEVSNLKILLIIVIVIAIIELIIIIIMAVCFLLYIRYRNMNKKNNVSKTSRIQKASADASHVGKNDVHMFDVEDIMGSNLPASKTTYSYTNSHSLGQTYVEKQMPLENNNVEENKQEPNLGVENSAKKVHKTATKDGIKYSLEIDDTVHYSTDVIKFKKSSTGCYLSKNGNITLKSITLNKTQQAESYRNMYLQYVFDIVDSTGAYVNLQNVDLVKLIKVEQFAEVYDENDKFILVSKGKLKVEVI